MISFVGYDKLIFGEFFKSLQSVCQNDPLKDLDPDGVAEHSDGWGYLDSNDTFINFSKFSEPIYRCTMPEFKGKYRIIHARNASKSQPMGFMKSHPYHSATLKFDHFLMHNGLVDKEKIRHNLTSESLEYMTDSEVLLDLICSFDGKDLETMLRNALKGVYSKNALISGLNIFFFSIGKDGRDQNLIIYSDALKFDEYHRLYYSEGNNWKCVYSSSILYSKYFPKAVHKIPLEPRTLYGMGDDGLVILSQIN